MKTTIRLFLPVIVILAMLMGYVPVNPVQAASPTDLFFTEYIEGSSNNKALEIYNGTGSTVNLATGGYNVQMFFNGSASAGLTINLIGTVAVGDVFVLAQSSANATILAQADQTNGAGWFNGDDAVVLRKGTTIVDTLGQIGFDPGTEWGTGLISTADNTLRRINTICAGDPNGSDVFAPDSEWEGFATDTFGGLGSHTASCSVVQDVAPWVTGSYPTDGATGIPISADLSVTFSEPVNVTDPWFTLSCSVSGSHPAVATGGPTTFTINPSSDFIGGESCTFTVIAGNISDQDSNDPPDTMVLNFTVGFSTFDVCAQPYTPIPAIQGSGATVALTGLRTTQGVVVGDYEGPSPALRGFFIQDPVGDGNPATSDGIFVFEGSNLNTVSLGDLVRVIGTAGENQGQSQISVGTIVKCGTGTVTPTDVTLPFASADFAEQYEGMLVRLPQTLFVTEHFQLGRFGQVVLSSGARLQQPTNVVLPGMDALALQAANNLNRIIIDDASQTQNPDPILFAREGIPLSSSNTLRGGDTATGIVGVLNYTWAGNSASPNAYRVRPINALNGYVNFEAVNQRPAEAPMLSGRIRVAGMNLLNFFNTFDGLPDSVDNCVLGVGGGPTDCRGADTQSEFDRQLPKTVAAIVGTYADVVGVIEIENDGYGPASAIQYLVDQLNAATGGMNYAYINVDAATGQINALGTDAIKVGLIYKPAVVTPVGQTAVLNTVEFVNGGDSAPRNRPALAQAFEEVGTGARFVVAVNHLKSKGSACDVLDTFDGQGECNLVRVNAANLLTSWLASDPTATGDTDALIIGDLNSYAMEDPITAIQAAGYTNLISAFIGPDAYSYVFDGQWGYLDHALGTSSLVPQVAGVHEWHINADEPSVLDYNTDFKTPNLINTLYAPNEFRISDHDPVLVDINLDNLPPVLGPLTGPVDPIMINTPVTVSASFTDPTLADTHTVDINWGDGTLTGGDITEVPGSGTATGTHTFASPGLYTVSMIVTDSSGGVSNTSIFEYVVVYDPNGGFVTGGGWINSPAGAYILDPGLTGKATFGFVAKYKKGATLPEGNTEFQFKAADFNFKSVSYEWLVVAGYKAQFKGSGTINGAGDYGFMLSAVDGALKNGKVDTFRIKIWDKGSGQVIYDNLLGAANDAEPTTALGGGSIIIHK